MTEQNSNIPSSPRKKIERDEHDRPLSPRLKESVLKDKSKPRLFHKNEETDSKTNEMIGLLNYLRKRF